MCDGVFDDESSELTSELIVASREYDKTNKQLENLAFREAFLMAKEESVQKGFDTGFNESFTNYSAIGKLKGLTIALLMGLPEDTDESIRKTGESIWSTLEDLEILLCDPERLKTTGLPVIRTSFENCKESLKEICNSASNTSPAAIELIVSIEECNLNLSQESIGRVTANLPSSSTSNSDEVTSSSPVPVAEKEHFSNLESNELTK